MVRLSSFVLVTVLAASARAQFTPFHHDTTLLLEGNWQSCRDAETGQYGERIFDQRQLGLEVHLGPGDEFAIFKGLQEEHRSHRSPDNLLQPNRVSVGRQRWELEDAVFDVAHAGGSRIDCRSFWITLAPRSRTP